MSGRTPPAVAAMLVLLAACHHGGAPGGVPAAEPAPPRVEAEDVEVTLGASRAHAGRVEGLLAGPWWLSGGVQAWLGGDAGVAGNAGPGVVPGDVPVEIEATRMRLDPRTRTATLEGAVRLRRGELRVESPRVVVTYALSGEVRTAEVAGPATARMEAVVLTAPGGARIDLARRVMELPGRVRIERNGAVIEGDGVAVDLTTGAVELRTVRGRLPTTWQGP